jgi:hypothetical protein
LEDQRLESGGIGHADADGLWKYWPSARSSMSPGCVGAQPLDDLKAVTAGT